MCLRGRTATWENNPGVWCTWCQEKGVVGGGGAGHVHVHTRLTEKLESSKDDANSVLLSWKVWVFRRLWVGGMRYKEF